MNTPTKIVTIVALIISGLSSAMAEPVDTELIILIDVSGNIENSVFEEQKQAYVDSFRSSAVIDAISKGRNKSIAVSMVLFAGNSQQYTAVEWMTIRDSASANAFATAVEDATAPFTGRNALGEALGYASKQFGHETGNAGNGYESLYQVIQITGNTKDNATGPRVRDRGVNVARARDEAVADGVDRIDGIHSDKYDNDLEGYFQQHVVIGEGSNMESHEIGKSLSPLLEKQLVSEIIGGTGAAVPEPSSTLLIGIGAACFLIRRERDQ